MKKNSRKISYQGFKVESFESAMAKIKKTGKRPVKPVDLPEGNWTPQAVEVLHERYLRKDEQGKVNETPDEMCWRVAWDIARAEVLWGASKKEVLTVAKDFYRMLVTRSFLPNSPTLMNAGTGNGLQYSGCYVLPVDDSLVGIFDAIKYQALVHQTGGGTGFSFSRLRPRGSIVKSSRGIASGPVSFMRIFDSATNEIKQGGRRRGANMGILRVDHPDILEFIHCKEGGGITNFNISVALTDKFMEALKNNGDYDLVDPKTKKVTGRLSAKKVFDEIAQAAWKTGDPGTIFLDRINRSGSNPVPEMGPVESTNPCVTGDTLISTQEGLVRMKEIVESHLKKGGRGGNMAVVIDNRTINTNNTNIKKIGTTDGRLLRFFDIGSRKVYKLKTRSGFELKATSDHQVLTPTGWKELLKLKRGDSVLIQSGRGRFSQNKKINVHLEADSYPNLWSKELGQILGWLIGDGWLRSGDKDCRVGFTFGEVDKDIMIEFKSVLNEWHGKEIKEIKRVRNTYHLSYHGKRFVNFFIDLGVQPRKAAFKKVPGSLFTAPEEAIIGFLQGLFTSDGTVRDSKKSNSDWIALTSKSRVLLQQVQLILLQFGIRSRIFDRSRKPRSGMFPYKAKDGRVRSYRLNGVLYELGIFGDCREQFKREIGFLNEKKQRRLENSRFRTRRRLKDPYLDKVEEVRFCGKEKVYDVTEILSHSIIANGLVVHQCGEQPLYPYDSCNLGSIFLNYFIKGEGKKHVDWERLKSVTRLATRFLDNVIEVNPYPLEEVRKATLAIRRVGLGVGGWADMLIGLEIAYDSEEALSLGKKVMKTIKDEAVAESQRLAKTRGVFPMWPASIYKKQTPRRNATVTTIAPTGSISIIAGASSGIEPLFALAFRHVVKDRQLNRTLTFINPEFRRVAEREGFWSSEVESEVLERGSVREIGGIPEKVKAIFTTAHDITYEWHVKHQAAFQASTENGVSKTINMKKDVTVDDVKKAYLTAWETNCKGVTVFRDGCKDKQVLNLGLKETEKKMPSAVSRPFMISGATYKINTPVGKAFLTINQDTNGEPLEMFINVGKAGSDVTAMAEALGRTISISLRFMGNLTPKARAREIALQLAGIGGRRSVGFGPNKVLSLPDAIAMALSSHFGFRINGFDKDGTLSEFATGVKETNSLTTNGELDGESIGAKLDLAEAETLAKRPDFVSGPAQKGTYDHFTALAESNSASLESNLAQTEEKVSLKDLCPSCGSGALVYEEGCSKCYLCGHSEC